MNKYITRNPKYTAEEAHRVFRMMENKLCDPFSGAQMVAGVHGGGSPVMETITMMARYDLEPLKGIARYLAGIDPEMPRYERADRHAAGHAGQVQEDRGRRRQEGLQVAAPRRRHRGGQVGGSRRPAPRREEPGALLQPRTAPLTRSQTCD